jgi:hypothetical protein
MATFTIYDHEEISGVLSEVVPFQHQLLNHFGNIMNFDTETIDFDKISDDLRVAIYVDPALSARNVRERGYSTKKYTAPYTKQKAGITPANIRKRPAGAPINNFGSPAERYAASLIEKATSMRIFHRRLLELTASQLLLAGSYTAVSDLYPTPVVVDFERNAGNTMNFATLNANGGVGKRVWGSTGGTATVSPVADLEEFFNLCQEQIQVVYMSDNAWAQFTLDPKFETALDITIRNLSASNFELMPKQGTIQGLKYRGMLASNGTAIYTFNGTYQHPTTGVITKYIPDGYVVGVPSSQFGTIAYGAIQHGEAGYVSVDEFWNMWMDEEFGIPYLQFQSAPMLVHTKINSTFAVKVI